MGQHRDTPHNCVHIEPWINSSQTSLYQRERDPEHRKRSGERTIKDFIKTLSQITDKIAKWAQVREHLAPISPQPPSPSLSRAARTEGRIWPPTRFRAPHS